MQFKRKHFFLFLLVSILISTPSFAQTATPFSARYQSNLNGDFIIISNQILNRIDKKNAPNQPYNDVSLESMPNDDFDMEYVDIDNDKNTFSSSSAALFLKNTENKKIVFAGLYWSATYKYESGYKKGEDKFVAYDDDRFSIDSVLIKFPGEKKYTAIKGEIIFDGYKQRDFKENAPYAVFADITTYVSSLENPFDFYTVANIRATQGTLFGGAAGGWSIVVVYEDKSLPNKSIAIYDGFAKVAENSVEITISNINAVAQGDVVARIAASTLEGDFTVDGDMIYFSSSTNPTFYNLKTSTRKTGNFFDSSITQDGEHFKYRIPDSKNTLGFDSFSTTIPNPGNTIIQNNVTEATVRFKTYKDQFYPFLTAFSIESKQKPIDEKKQVEEIATTKIVYKDNSFQLIDIASGKVLEKLSEPQKVAQYKLKTNDEIKTIIDSLPEEPLEKVNEEKGKKDSSNDIAFDGKSSLSVKKTRKEDFLIENQDNKKTALKTQKEDSIIKAPIQKEALNKVAIDPKVKEEKKEQVENAKSIETPKRETKLNNVDAPKGYYVVVNVFSERYFAVKFMMDTRAKGLNPNYFVNPQNNYIYVYLNYSLDKSKMQTLVDSKYNNLYKDEIWLMEVNIE